MKKVIFTLLLFVIAVAVHATTYYYIGGLSSNTWTNGNNWTTDPVGRAPVGGTIIIATTDVYVFDGTNVGGASPVTGPVTFVTTSLSATPFAQLKFINGANITFNRSTTGSAVIALNGDGTSADDLIVDASSTITLGGPAYDNNIQITMTVATTGFISGAVYLSPLSTTLHTRSYITPAAANSLVFATGSNCYISDSTASSGFNGAVAKSIVFQSGANLYYYTGRSPFGNNSTTQYIDFLAGSNCYIMRTNTSYVDNTAYGSSSWTNNKYFANLYIQNGATFTADGPIYKIENFTINSGCTFVTHTSGQTGITGTLTVNGTLNSPAGAANTNNIVFGADGNQTITGTGTIDVSAITVSSVTNLTLNDNIILESTSNNSSVLGSLDLGTKQISGPANFSAKGVIAPVTYNGNITSGSSQITNVSGTISGITGELVSGPGIQPNTVVLAFSASSFTINLSKPATAPSTGVDFTFSNPTASTVKTSNAGGLDASITTATKSFAAGTNYTFNTATTSPFPASSSNPVGNITANANITSNKVVYTSGVVTLNAAKFTIRGVDSLHLTTTASFGGTYNSSQYIATDVSGSTVGVVVIDSFTTTKTFPVGTPTYYMPVILTPASQTTFAVSVFQGITEDGTPTGTPFTPTKKASVVDAVWTINRMTSNTDNTTMTLNWPQALEGSAFTTFPNNQVGISKNNASTWTVASGSGDNTNNTATSTFNSFSPFAVGQVGVALPIKLTNIVAKEEQGKIKLQWSNETESNTYSYEIERSQNGISFTAINSVLANGNHQYSVYDNNPFNTNYYRIVIKDINGNIYYSNVVRVSLNSSKPEVSVYPNPVKNGELNLQLSNLSKGTVQLSLYSNAGQRVFSGSVEYNGGIQNQAIQLPSTIVKGTYQLIIKTNSETIKQSLLVQ